MVTQMLLDLETDLALLEVVNPDSAVNYRRDTLVLKRAIDTGRPRAEARLAHIRSRVAHDLTAVYGRLDDYQRFLIARTPQRPSAREIIPNIFDFGSFEEYHSIHQDPSLVAGLVEMSGMKSVVIGIDKNTPSRGYVTAAGYKKAQEAIALAENLNRPIITLIDTYGADADDANLVFKEISACLYALGKAKVPILAVVTGVGFSGGAVALGLADMILMCENSVYSVMDPSAIAVLQRKNHKDPRVMQELSNNLKFSASHNKQFGTIDDIILEQGYGGHADKSGFYTALHGGISSALGVLSQNFEAQNAAASRTQKYLAMSTYATEHHNTAFSSVMHLLGDLMHRSKPKEIIHHPQTGTQCSEFSRKILVEQYDGVCPNVDCGYHYDLMPSAYYVSKLVDNGNFIEFNEQISSTNVLDWPLFGRKLSDASHASKSNSALRTGYATLDGIEVIVTINEMDYRTGTVGSAEAWKMYQAIKRAKEERKPLIALHRTGGARVEEGLFALMHMPLTILGLIELEAENIPYISIMLNNTYGGVAASYASQSPHIIAEKNAMIGFTGLRIMNVVLDKNIPEITQQAETHLQNNGITAIFDRRYLREIAITELRKAYAA